MEARKVCVITGKRIPFARSFSKYMGKTNQELLTEAAKNLVSELGLEDQIIGEFVSGSVLKHSSVWLFILTCSPYADSTESIFIGLSLKSHVIFIVSLAFLFIYADKSKSTYFHIKKITSFLKK